MPAFIGPNPAQTPVFKLDAANFKSTLRKKQDTNILVSPHLWTLGTGGTSGYSANGSSTEQLRSVVVDGDPWGRTSILWTTTPDATSGADGGWNSSYYTIDAKHTYRWSVWVKRHTSGTGGTFYLGMNPPPIRNDNDAVQNNPYFTFPGQSTLALNQWYFVVGHCFHEDYTGGRHPDSGWYENGIKISDKSYGNVGTQDVRWNPGTTSAMHRTYHFYTTNTNSGLRFAFPRLDKCDGTEPTIQQLIQQGESGWQDMMESKYVLDFPNHVTHTDSVGGEFGFDGVDDYVDLGSDLVISPDNQGWTAEYWLKTQSPGTLQSLNSAENDEFNANWISIYQSKMALWNRTPGYWRFGSTVLQANTWYHLVYVCDAGGTNYRFYLNGSREGGDHVNNVWNSSYSSLETRYIGRYEFNGGYSRYFNGDISQVSMYNRALTADEVRKNFVAHRKRYGI